MAEEPKSMAEPNPMPLERTPDPLALAMRDLGYLADPHTRPIEEQLPKREKVVNPDIAVVEWSEIDDGLAIVKWSVGSELVGPANRVGDIRVSGFDKFVPLVLRFPYCVCEMRQSLYTVAGEEIKTYVAGVFCLDCPQDTRALFVPLWGTKGAEIKGSFVQCTPNCIIAQIREGVVFDTFERVAYACANEFVLFYRVRQPDGIYHWQFRKIDILAISLSQIFCAPDDDVLFTWGAYSKAGVLLSCYSLPSLQVLWIRDLSFYVHVQSVVGADVDRVLLHKYENGHLLFSVKGVHVRDEYRPIVTRYEEDFPELKSDDDIDNPYNVAIMCMRIPHSRYVGPVVKDVVNIMFCRNRGFLRDFTETDSRCAINTNGNFVLGTGYYADATHHPRLVYVVRNKNRKIGKYTTYSRAYDVLVPAAAVPNIPLLYPVFINDSLMLTAPFIEKGKKGKENYFVFRATEFATNLMIGPNPGDSTHRTVLNSYSGCVATVDVDTTNKIRRVMSKNTRLICLSTHPRGTGCLFTSGPHADYFRGDSDHWDPVTRLLFTVGNCSATVNTHISIPEYVTPLPDDVCTLCRRRGVIWAACALCMDVRYCGPICALYDRDRHVIDCKHKLLPYLLSLHKPM